MTYYQSIKPTQPPFPSGVDSTNRVLFKFNIMAVRRSTDTFEEELLAILSAAGVGVQQTTMFVAPKATIPPTQENDDTAILSVQNTGGAGPIETQNEVNPPAYQRASAQIVVRSHDHKVARAMAYEAAVALNAIRNQEIGPLGPAPAEPIPGMSLWIDFGDSAKVFQDTGVSVPVVADGDPVRGVVGETVFARKMLMSGGFDPLLWRPSLMACESFRHDALSPDLKASGWNIGDLMNVAKDSVTFFLIGSMPMADGALMIAMEGYGGISYNTIMGLVTCSVWNGASADTVSFAVPSDMTPHIIMFRISPGLLEAGIDDLTDAALHSTPSIGFDSVAKTQPLRTANTASPTTSRYNTILAYPSKLSEHDALLVAFWARVRFGIV